MSAPVTLSLMWLRATRGAGNPNIQVSITYLPTSLVTLIQGLIMIPLQILLMPVAEHRSFLFFLFLGKQRQVQSERGDPMALSLFTLKT